MNLIAQNFLAFWPTWLVGLAIAITASIVVIKFFIPAWQLKGELAKELSALSTIKNRVGDGKLVQLQEIEDVLKKTPELAHAWSEYTKTLHPQSEVDSSGQSRIVCWRATTLAETFFSGQSVVNTPLKADFYKHFPGILTGLGIIGTFLGLIVGLSSFDVSDPAKAQSELKNLINAVGHAFYVSGAAITLAMIFTWIEKFLVTASHQQLSGLVQLVDKFFDAGAGEEYLARLVTASETQATQAAHIKDALVTDLKEILTTLAQKQMEVQSQHTRMVLQAQANHSVQMSADVGKAIADHLGGPIADIASAVKGVSANQGDAVNKMLTDVLSGFSAQMQDIFGGQMRGMTDLLKETSEAMKSSAEKFTALATNMDSAGQDAVEGMGKRLNAAITAMDVRQQVMNKNMGEFVGQIRDLVSTSQTESSRKLQETLGQVGEQVAGIVAALRKQAEASAESQGQRQARFEQSTGNVVQSLSVQMESLMTQSIETNRTLQGTVARLSAATGEAISGMNQGANTLQVAALDFATAGQGVADTMRGASEATENIRLASATLSTATSATKEMLTDYGRARDAFAAMVIELRSVTENARRDAAMTSEIISRIESAAGKLGEAQRQSEAYLEGVNNVLVKTHESFSDHVGKTLREGNRQFQDELRSAVDMVSAAVRDLSDTLEDIPGRRH